MKRVRLPGLVVALATLASALVGATRVGATDTHFTYFDQPLVHQATKYAQPTTLSGPTNWVSPVNYRDGTVYARFEVTAKPTDMALAAQLCLWRDNLTQETCSPLRSFSGEGVHWFDLGRPSSWWKKGGTWDYDRPATMARFMIKDPSRGELLMTGSCGAACYEGPATVADHVPIEIDASVIVVAKGASLVPPTEWTGCPSAWTLGCLGVGATRSARLIASQATPVANDRPYLEWLGELGFAVTVVDDNKVTAASLAGADLVVISSTAVATAVPAWIAGLDVPILSSEAKLAPKLGLGASGVDLTGQTKIKVVAPTSPLAAGLSGTTTVASSTAVGGVKNVRPGVAVVATANTNAAVATLVGVDTGVSLPTGITVDRRVGFFLGAPAPPKATAATRALFAAAVDWLTAPADAPAPWWDPGWAHRQTVTLPATAVDRPETTFTAAIDLTPVTADGDPVSVDSLRVVEVDGGGAVTDDQVSFQFDPDPGFDATTAATGTLTVVAAGMTPAAVARRYDLYADRHSAGHQPATVVARVITTVGPVDEGQPSVHVAADGAEWFYHLQGGGFSSLVDADGNDWISYRTAAGSAGAYRGIPNAVHPQGHFHPGTTTSTTTVASSGPLRTVIESTAAGGRWKVRWELFPTIARMTMVAADDDYWFLYEGTPGGSIDSGDTVLRSSRLDAIATSWTDDLADPEWVAFTDPAVGRALVIAHPGSDSTVDSYRLMNGEMTVFGFGRSGVNDYLTGVHRFVVGLVESPDPSVVAVAAAAAAVDADGIASAWEERVVVAS